MTSHRTRASWRAGARRLAPLVLLGGLACEARNTEPAPAAARANPVPAPPSEAPPSDTEPGTAPVTLPPDTRPTIGRASSPPDAPGSLALASGAKLPLDMPVVLPRRASLELHFPGGAAVRVVGPGRLAVPTGPTGLLVEEGTVTVDLERSALRPESGFWLATPRARIDLVQGARFALRAFSDRSSELTAISGVLAVTALKAEETAATRLPAGGRAVISADGRLAIRQAAERSPLHLETEAARLSELPERPAKRQAAAAGVPAAVEAACEALVSSVTREGELSARHRALVAQNDSQAMELQRELARQGAQTFAARRTLGKRLSLLEADSLSQGTSPFSSPLIARARELLR